MCYQGHIGRCRHFASFRFGIETLNIDFVVISIELGNVSSADDRLPSSLLTALLIAAARARFLLGTKQRSAIGNGLRCAAFPLARKTTRTMGSHVEKSAATRGSPAAIDDQRERPSFS